MEIKYIHLSPNSHKYRCVCVYVMQRVGGELELVCLNAA